jgi:nucleoside-diphosphate-sugar epimerase
VNVLITGGAGFIGSNLARTLAKHGHRVRVLDNLSTGNLANLEGVQVEFTAGSVTDWDAIRAAVADTDVVFHEAALPSVPRSVKDPAATHEANATGTLTVLRAALEAGVRRLVYASSSSAYGNIPDLPKREDMTPRPISPYAVSKLAGEHYCRAFTETYGLETVCLRYFNVFGPFQDPAGGYAAVIPRFISKILAGEPPTIDGDGRQTRDFTYVDNVVAANLAASAAGPQVSGEVFNIGAGASTSVLEVCHTIVAISGRHVEPLHGPERVGDVRDSWADIGKARELLGYQPEVEVRAGLEKTVAWFRERLA